MNNRAQVELQWGDGTYVFRLGVTHVLELESKCEAPIAVIFSRVHKGEYGLRDIRETIRLGLQGGGLTDAETLRVVEQQFDNRLSEIGFAGHQPVAYAILLGVMFGFANDPLAPPGTDQAETNPGDLTPPRSTPKRADLDSPRET